MVKYIVKRILMLIPVLLGVMLIVFIFQSLSTDDPAAIMLGEGASEELKEAKRAELGLDDPMIVQYGRYVWNFVTEFDLGTSYKSGNPVSEELLLKWPMTIKLAIISVFLAVLIGIPLGVLSAVKQYTWFDSGVLAVSVFLSSVPGFWLALMFMYLFAVLLNWLPATGLSDGLRSWVLPVAVVSLQSMSGLIRTTRSSMLESIRQDYIRTARAKGQKERVVILKHALRNSLIPIISNTGNTLGMQLGGALIVESVFGLPGIGKYAVDSIAARNYPSVLGSVVILAFTYTVINLLVDICYMLADPRMKSNFVKKGKKKKNLSTVLAKTEEV